MYVCIYRYIYIYTYIYTPIYRVTPRSGKETVFALDTGVLHAKSIMSFTFAY